MLVSWSECRLLENTQIVPCTPDRLDASAVEADPLYGIFLYDRERDTQLPVVVPEEGQIEKVRAAIRDAAKEMSP